MFQVRDKDKKTAYACVYCEKLGHKSSECELVSRTPKRRLILSKGNCTLIEKALNNLLLTAAVIKRVPIVKENITHQFVKKRQMFY